MNARKLTMLAPLILAAAFAACLSEDSHPIVPPTGLSAGMLLVDTGFTQGSPGIWLYDNLGEYSAFTLRWSEVENASYYEIRASENPVTPENWSDAQVVATVQAPADSALVFNVVSVLTEPCIACGLCENVCPMGAISVEGGVAVIDYDRCTSCGLCMDVCPVNAIAGTRNGQNYFFGLRGIHGDGTPAEDIAVTGDSYRVIYFNAFGSFWGPQTKNCGLCQAGEDSLGCYGGCHILEDWADQDRQVFTGYGCPFDAVWQDTMGVGPVSYMVYVDYDKCVSCGVCFMECWNYNQTINDNPAPYNYQGLKSMMRKVVPSGWVTNQPLRP
jgi:ferredoxin